MARKAKKTNKSSASTGPGEWYNKISLPSIEKMGETSLLKADNPPFVSFCKSVYSKFPSLACSSLCSFSFF